MIYPSHFEEKTGFSQIREMVKNLCLSGCGAGWVDEMSFSDDYTTVIRRISEVEEFRQILLFGSRFPDQDYFDMLPELLRIKLPGTFIEPEQLMNLKKSYFTIGEILGYFKRKENDKYPVLESITTDVSFDKGLVTRIEKIIDDKGHIRDDASVDLAAIRRRLKSLNRSIEKQIRHFLVLAKKEGWVEEGVEPTIRNGRSVLPVPAVHKRKIRGFIHDESATGQTVYIEPAEVLDANNEIRELEIAGKREIIKILTRFTDSIRVNLSEIIAAYGMLGIFDFIRAKALFAVKTYSLMPSVRNESFIGWLDALHPLLYLSHKSQGKDVVSQNIRLDSSERIMVISGPNAGGKSVCLKMTGLLQYMLQCGMLIPVKDTSEAGLFNQIFIEIGDEQSLENDLSTYSSHLLNLRYFVENANPGTLFLIDELGAGTEPQSGGAIAEAVLEKLNEKKAMGLVTTHYSNLKVMPSEHEGMISAAMLFDVKKLKPLYKLKTGLPGSSFAFEIAGLTGLPGEIIQKATSLLDSSRVEYEKQLQLLENEKEEVKTKMQGINVADDLLSEVFAKYERMYEEIRDRKEHILNEARKEARELIESSNRIIERTIQEIRISQAEKEKTKAVRKELEEFAAAIPEPLHLKPVMEKKSRKKTAMEKPPDVIQGPVLVGDVVRVKDTGALGEVVKVAENKISVDFGSVQLLTTRDKIEKVSARKTSLPQEENRSLAHMQFIDELNRKKLNFNPRIDLRGKRVEESLAEIREFIDDASLLGLKELSILHGKGYGILRKVIREYLAGREEVESFNDEHPERGGAGITLVYLR